MDRMVYHDRVECGGKNGFYRPLKHLSHAGQRSA